jgi:single-stranded DNA-binding protein
MTKEKKSRKRNRLVAWGKTLTSLEKFVTKGKEIAIEGKLTHRSYDDKTGRNLCLRGGRD